MAYRNKVSAIFIILIIISTIVYRIGFDRESYIFSLPYIVSVGSIIAIIIATRASKTSK